MIETLPKYISIVFGLTTVVTLLLFYQIIKKSTKETTRKNAWKIMIALIVWLAIQAILTLNNIYNSNTFSLPPKIFVFGILPTILIITMLFLTKKGKQFIDSLPLLNISYLHTVRIPVEIVLWWLYLNKTIPEIMTFEGRNFDIIAGITAPFIAYFGIKKSKIGTNYILIWNLLCLGLLINIAINGFLSAPTPLQQFALNQPNTAILNFPFSWLVSFIVPLVLFGHMVSIRQLLYKR